MQREPQGQLCQMIHVRLFAALLDVVQSLHLEKRVPSCIWLHGSDLGAKASSELALNEVTVPR